MPLDSAQVQADPFLHVASIIKSHLRWMSEAITNNFSYRLAFRLDGHPAGSNTFILDNSQGGRQAAVAFVKHHIDHPQPKSLHAFHEAVKSGPRWPRRRASRSLKSTKCFKRPRRGTNEPAI